MPETPRLLYDDARYPEGPARVEDTLYFVEYARNAIQALTVDPEPTPATAAVRTVFTEPGLGFAAVIPGPDGLLWATAYDGNRVVAVSPHGEPQVSVAEDEQGAPFRGPNDLVFDAEGGLWFTASGAFERSAPAEGRVGYRAPEGVVRAAADGIHYANGIAMRPDGAVLYVAEHFRNRILAYPVQGPGRLGPPQVHADLTALAPLPPGHDPKLGPDGMKCDPEGRLFIAQYGGGRVLVVAPDSALERVLPLPYPYTTNCALSADRATLYVTAFRADAPPFTGGIFALPL